MKPPSLAPAYAFVFPLLAQIAQQHGYALALHGSMTRDLDVVACPWTEDACSAEELFNAILEAENFKWIDIGPDHPLCQPGPKPHGRIAYTIILRGPAFIDLSIMPRIPNEP